MSESEYAQGGYIHSDGPEVPVIWHPGEHHYTAEQVKQAGVEALRRLAQRPEQ